MKKILKAFFSIIFILLILQITRAYFYCNSAPPLELWHLKSSFKEPEYRIDIEKYLEEEKIFLNSIYNKIKTKEMGVYCRYSPNSICSPIFNNNENLNSSFQLIPKKIKGGVLLLHGLTDSPAMMRDIGNYFYEQGYYVLCLRYKFHGTIPGELLKISWKDFVSTTIWGSKIIKEKIKAIPNSKFYIVGFSTGAAASLEYITNERKKDNTLLKPDGIFWLSPAMGVSPAAKIGFLDLWTAKIKGFEKFNWLDIFPEYDPCKYNSFPKNAGIEVDKLIEKARKSLKNLTEKEIYDLPPIYSYNSLIDATVIEKDLYKIFENLKNPRNELTIFDVNRKFEYFFSNKLKQLNINNKIQTFKFNSKINFITNYKTKSDNNIELLEFMNNKINRKKLDLAWYPFVFSLSHVALPISPKNTIYGSNSILGRLEVKGENDSLAMSANLLYRLRYNPFFEFIKHDISNKIET